MALKLIGVLLGGEGPIQIVAVVFFNTFGQTKCIGSYFFAHGKTQITVLSQIAFTVALSGDVSTAGQNVHTRSSIRVELRLFCGSYIRVPPKNLIARVGPLKGPMSPPVIIGNPIIKSLLHGAPPRIVILPFLNLTKISGLLPII